MAVTEGQIAGVLDEVVGEDRRVIVSDGHNVTVWALEPQRYQRERILRALWDVGGGGPFTFGVAPIGERSDPVDDPKAIAELEAALARAEPSFPDQR